MAEPQWIASSEVIFVNRDGKRLAGSIRISHPDPADEHDAQCWYTLEPVVKGRNIFGSDSLQALLLAIRMCAMELAMFEERGGRVEYLPAEDGTPGPRWDPSTTFGALFRLPGEPDASEKPNVD